MIMFVVIILIVMMIIIIILMMMMIMMMMMMMMRCGCWVAGSKFRITNEIFSNFTKLNSHLSPLISDHLIIFVDNDNDDDDDEDDDDVC
jgi:hypothetical protein